MNPFAGTGKAHHIFKTVVQPMWQEAGIQYEVFETTGCLPGAVPPFGKIFGLKVYVDRSLSKQNSINFNCGLRTKSISMSYEDYFKFE